MASRIIQPQRIKALNDNTRQNGNYVLYWMQQAQRAEDNHALEFAIQQANERSEPLLVAFGLMDDYPEANLRHYVFMLQGLKEVIASLARRNIKMVVQRGHPRDVAIKLAKHSSLLVCDRGYLRHQKAWRDEVATQVACQVIQVESDVVVPVEVASDKREYAARTIRPKLHKQLEAFLVDLNTTALSVSSLDMRVDGLDLSDPLAVAKSLKLPGQVPEVSQFFKGGTTQAKTRLRTFLDEHFKQYTPNRNQPHTTDISHMSMHLHFGQISPLYIAQQVRYAGASQTNTQAYIEELIVRRELAMNYVNFTNNYDAYESLPDWAQRTLAKHRNDPREHLYTPEELANADTHDPYWNAAMNEMRTTGFMHNYMRMYWGKKILEWCPSPQDAFETTLWLNNTFFLDGRDANSFSNVAWVFGNHDRPWAERSIFGTVRYMNANGLKRKTDPGAYVQKVQAFMAQT